MGEDDFIPVDLEEFIGENRSFVSGKGGKGAFEVDYRVNSSGELRASVIFKERSTGPPGHAHGGATAAVIDEAMGIACWLRGIPVVTRRLTVDFIRMVPLDTRTELTCDVTDDGEGDVNVKSSLTDTSGEKIYTVGKGRFARIPLSRLGDLGDKVKTKIGGMK